ncbi:MAG: acyltransferase family protein [Oscillospiraceae bacterium]|nr:acyltransferase family protein [Oscillospiraceae bacterium]
MNIWKNINVKINGGGVIYSSSKEYAFRIYGVDAIKILAMFMVVILHILGKGKILENTETFSAQYEVAWLLEIACYCAVNCFALATGYLLVDREFKYSRIILMWLQVVFYSILLTVVISIWQYDGIGIMEFAKSLIKSVFPVSFKQYWYFSAYFGLYLLSPFLNRLIKGLTKQEMKWMCISMIIIFFIIPTAFMQDPFDTAYGYSVLWLVVIYMIGAYIKLYDPFAKIGAMKMLGKYVVCVGITWLSKLLIGCLTSALLGEAKLDGYLISYTSPKIFLSAVALFMAFIRMRFTERISQLLVIVSPLSFAVYLIHEHPLMREYVVPYERFGSFVELNPLLMVIFVLGAAVLIYSACIVIERIRIELFRLIRVRSLAEKIDRWLRKAKNRILNFECYGASIKRR